MFCKKKTVVVSEEKPVLVDKKSNGFYASFEPSGSDDEVKKAMIAQKAFPVIPNLPKIPVGMDGDDQISHGMDAAMLKSAFSVNANQLPDALFGWYTNQSFIGHQACAILAQNWIINKACVVPAKDSLRKGWELTVNDGTNADIDELAKLRRLDKKYGVKKFLSEYEQFRRVFGVRIAIFVVKSGDRKYYEKPFNIDGVTKGSYKGLLQVDPYWITPELDIDASSNPATQHFYEPTFWRINGQRYHRSHLVISRYSELPDVLKPSYIYGGLPLPQLIYERAYAAERTANEAPQLAMTKRTTGLYIDMEAALGKQSQIEEKMSFWAKFRDNFGIKLLGTEEKMEQFDTSLADFDSVIMSQYQLVAAIAGMPATKILETSPKGFNTTGEFETVSYHESLETIQDDVYQPILEGHYERLIKSEGLSFDVDITWNPLKTMDDKEVAELNESKSRTDTALAAAGAIDGFDIRNRIAEDEKSGYNGIELAPSATSQETEVEEEEINEDAENFTKQEDQFDWVQGIDAIENGYVSVRPRMRDAAKYFAAAAKAGIEDLIEPDKMHVTVMQSSEPIPSPDYDWHPSIATPTGEIKVIGDGEYQAIAIMLDSEDLDNRHEEIRLMGGVHSYAEFVPHISLKYKPTDQDIQRIQNIDISSEPIILMDERWSSTKD